MQSYTFCAITVYGFLHSQLTLGVILARRTWCIGHVALLLSGPKVSKRVLLTPAPEVKIGKQLKHEEPK